VPHDVQRLRRARLTPRQMQCLALYYYDGMSQEQIGRHLGIGQRVVSQHLQYGRDKLAVAELSIRRISTRTEIRITHMDTETLDRLTSEVARGLW